MDKNKLIPIILLVVILVIGFFAFQFYNQSSDYQQKADRLSQENGSLVQENRSLREKASDLSNQKKEMEAKWTRVEDELARLESENSDLKKKYTGIVEERDMLVEKLKEKPSARIETKVVEKIVEREVPGSGNSEEYWADFVKAKAELEAKLTDLERELLNAKNAAADFDKTNKELSIKIDELSKIKERLDQELKLKERTITLMSRDLVSEREARKASFEELNKLRAENVSLKREMVLANKEKVKLQTNLSESIVKKDSLERRISEIDNIMKEKSMALQELQDQLGSALDKGEEISGAAKAPAVELPPIVVQPEVAGVKGLKGSVIAVDNREKFVVVDLGEIAGAKPGMRMKILRGDKEIATIEVIETRREISAADIKDSVSGFTIQEGDTVISK